VADRTRNTLVFRTDTRSMRRRGTADSRGMRRRGTCMLMNQPEQQRRSGGDGANLHGAQDFVIGFRQTPATVLNIGFRQKPGPKFLGRNGFLLAMRCALPGDRVPQSATTNQIEWAGCLLRFGTCSAKEPRPRGGPLARQHCQRPTQPPAQRVHSL
jgi:hypothetical protein